MTLEAIHVPDKEHASEPLQGSASAFSRGSDVIFAVVICLTLVAAVWLRWSGLNAQSFWADEGFTTWFSQFSPGAQWHVLRWDNSAPLFYVVVHYWVTMWGSSETAFRALSALFSTLSLGVFYLVARRMFQSRFSIVLGLMLYSFSFFQIWYAKEARCYALFGFLLLTSLYCMLLCLKRPNALRLFGLVLALSATLYTHNIALYYLPGFVAFWFIYPSPMEFKERTKNATIVGAIVFLFYIPWLPILIDQIRAVHGYFWAPRPSATDLFTTLCVFSGVDVNVLKGARYHLPIPFLFGFWSWVLMLLFVLALCMVGTWRGVCSADRRKSLALQAYTFLPILLMFVWSRVSTSVYVNRNLIGACALLPLVLCAPSAVQVENRKRLFQVVACSVLLGAVISLGLHRESKEDWRGVTEYLVKIPERQRLVVAFQPFCQILVHYYSTGLLDSNSKPEITGLIQQFNVVPRGPGILPNLDAADPIATLSQAVDAHKYKEIDVALQSGRMPVKVQAIPEFLRSHCSSVENIEFDRIAVSRCLLTSN
jgi:hypothetical protein